MPDLATPAAPAPAAPSAPSAPAPVSSTPAAPATPAPATPAAPAAPATPAAASPTIPATPAKYDPQTATAPPKSSDFANDQEGLIEFTKANSAWSQAHPEEAEKLRAAKVAEEEGSLPTVEASVAEAVKAAEGEQPKEAPKPAGEPVSAATPAAIEEWTSKSPELKAAFDKNPELQGQIMQMARENEAAKPVLEIVGSKEEAQFAVEHAQRLVSLQTNWMLSGEDPEMVGPAWDQTVEMFKERDANGAEVKGPDGKPKLGSDFKPFVRKAASSAMEDFATGSQAQISALEAKLAGNYPTDEAREADEKALEDAKYEKAAFDFVLHRLANPEEQRTQLPALPPNATKEQIAYQEQLKKERADLDAKHGKQTTDSRKATRVALNKEVQRVYEAGVNTYIETQVNAMKERGEYLPDFVLNDKWINPQTGKVTNVSALGVKIYLALNDKINKNPTHAAKLMSLEALGAEGKDARLAEIARLQTLYLPKIFNAEVTRIQDGIRASSKNAPKVDGTVARVEPQSQGTVVPQAMDKNQVRAWAETEAKKQPGFDDMDGPTRETLIISLAMKKRFGG